MTDFQDFQRHLNNDKELLTDQVYVFLADAADELDREQRTDMLRYEAINRHNVPEQEFEGWLADCAARWKADPEGFQKAIQVEEALRRKLDEAALDPWPPLEPFEDGIVYEEPFPVKAFGHPLGDYIEAVAHSLQVPVDMVGTTLLGVLAACVQGKYQVNVRRDWFEPLSLFVCTIAEPGERKSAVLSRLRKPLDRYEQEQNERDAMDIKQSQAMHAALERKLSSLQDRFAKGTGKNKVTEQDIQEAVAELEEHEVLHPLRLTCSDVTSEKLAAMMYENRERMALFSAEGGPFDNMSGKKYGNGADNFDIFLNGHAGDKVLVDRLGRSPIVLHSPALTLVLMVQPEVLGKVLSNEAFRGKGLVGRFLYSWPESLLGRRIQEVSSVRSELEASYQEIIETLAALQPLETGCIRLSEDTRKYLNRYADTIEPALNKTTGQFRHMTDWAGKYVGTVCRIAGILHCVQYRDEEPDRIPVSIDTLVRAIDMGTYFLAMADRIFKRAGKDGVVVKAQRLWERIHEKGYHTLISKDDLSKISKKMFDSAAERGNAVTELIERGYLRVFKDPVPQFGRPKTLYEIRPEREMGNVIQREAQSA